MRMDSQPAEPLKFQHKKILEFLMKEERELASLKAFLKSCEDFEKKGAENIAEFAKDMAAAGTKIANKQLVKSMAAFSIHSTEKDHAQSNVKLITEKLYPWLDSAIDILKQLKQKSRSLQEQNSRKAVAEEEVKAYKEEVKKQMVKVGQLKESIISWFCHNLIKNGSQQMEELTNKLQMEHERRTSVNKAV